MQAREKTQSMQPILSLPVAFFVCVHCVRCGFFDLRRMTSNATDAMHACQTCVASVALRTAAWKPTFKIRFHGPTCGFPVVVHNTRNALDARRRTACDAIKNRNTCRMHAKNNARIDSILCVHCAFRRFLCAYIACVACVAYSMLETGIKSVFCILMVAALFRCSTCVRQPAIAKFLFHYR